jgi:hypothetical protein
MSGTWPYYTGLNLRSNQEVHNCLDRLSDGSQMHQLQESNEPDAIVRDRSAIEDAANFAEKVVLDHRSA